MFLEAGVPKSLFIAFLMLAYRQLNYRLSENSVSPNIKFVSLRLSIFAIELQKVLTPNF